MNETRTQRPGFWHRVALAVAPGTMASRKRARIEMERLDFQQTVLDHATRLFRAGYQGASTEVGYSGWNPGGGSPDSDLIPDLPTLRERARDLVRSDPHAAGLVDTWVSNVSGMRPQSRIDAEELGLTPAQVDAFQRAAEKVWERWGEHADVAARLDALELQELALRSYFENGDAFLLPRPIGTGRYKTAVQVIEADRVTTPQSLFSDDTIREGVKVGPNGEHEGYWIKKTHPGDNLTKFNDFAFVPRFAGNGRQLVHQVISIRRPDQSRGVPFIAPALLSFKDLQGYFRAELVGAKVAASYALFITMADPLLDMQQAASAAATVDATRQTAQSGIAKQYVSPGMIQRLAPGENVVSTNPNRPNSAFPEFTERVLRSIGASIQMPYEDVAQDFSKTNYSSARAALTNARRVYRKVQNWFARKYLQPIWVGLLEEAYLLGDLPAPGFLENMAAYTRCQWVGQGWTWVDPAKEIKATELALDKNLTTLADEAASQGKDWEEIMIQRSREIAREKELGIWKDPNPPPVEPGVNEDAAQDDDENDGEQPEPE